MGTFVQNGQDTTTMLYRRNRYFDPNTGRFTQEDPIGIAGGVNQYGFANGDPVNFSDPFGLCVTPETAPVCLLVAQQTGMALAAGAEAAAVGTLVGIGAAAASVDLIAGSLNTAAVGTLRSFGLKDAHHVIQDAAVRELPGYISSEAPGVQLLGPANGVGSPHHAATAVQRQAGGGTYAAERRIAYKALRAAGLSQGISRSLIEQADRYFNGLGISGPTITRIPGNRPR